MIMNSPDSLEARKHLIGSGKAWVLNTAIFDSRSLDAVQVQVPSAHLTLSAKHTCITPPSRLD